MTITNDLVERFQTVHNNKFGFTIGYSDAESQLKALASLVRHMSEQLWVKQNV